MKAIAVIGGNFGDEGKGRMVDHFAAQSASVVVRYNGGAQAGHTVVTPAGRRHVFHHHGAGTFAGAPTFLSRFFVVNPFIWHHERTVLGDSPAVHVDPFAPVTTPYDMLVNREIENARGANRHGSCGLGFAETVERICNSPYRLFYRDVAFKGFADEVKRIRDEYAPKRLTALGIQTPSTWYREVSTNNGLLDEYLENCASMVKACGTLPESGLSRFGQIVFEGAQGLGLDEGHSFYPHVTRSRTGIANVAEICKAIGVERVEAVYVTRAYTTRHGAGPLPTENLSLTYEDDTNTPNEWQGALRFGDLDVDLLSANVANDLRKAGGLHVDCSLAVTHLDQVGDAVPVVMDGRKTAIPVREFPGVVGKAIGASKVYATASPRRS